jgi:hypothetical protein
MTDSQAIFAVVCTGIVLPAIYTVFVIYLTRRGKEFSRMDGLFSSMEKLHKALHSAFMAERGEKPLKTP